MCCSWKLKRFSDDHKAQICLCTEKNVSLHHPRLLGPTLCLVIKIYVRLRGGNGASSFLRGFPPFTSVYIKERKMGEARCCWEDERRFLIQRGLGGEVGTGRSVHEVTFPWAKPYPDGAP